MNSLEKELGKNRIDPIDLDDDDEDEDIIPGTVFNERQAKMLRNAVVVMGIMLVAGFALLIGIIAYRAAQPATPPAPIAPAGVGVPHSGLQTPAAPPQTATTTLARQGTRLIEATIPKGATYLDSTINGNRLIMTLQTPAKDLQLVLIDLSSWRITGKALLKQKR